MLPIRQPGSRDLRIFGALVLVFTFVAGTMAFARHESTFWAASIWTGGGILTAVYFAVPRLRRPVYLGWMYAVFPIGWVVSRTVLAAIFFGIVTPIGVALRLAGHDPMNRRRGPDRDSYWEPFPSGRKPEDYFRQF